MSDRKITSLIPRAARLLKGVTAYASELPARGYIDARASFMLQQYRARRDRYALEAERRGLLYDPSLVAARTAQRLAASQLEIRPRPRGAPVHTLAYFPKASWHEQLLAPLRTLGPLSHFDYNDHGLKTADLYARRPFTIPQRERACDAFERFAADAARRQPVDWVFVYVIGIEMLVPTLARVRAITGAPVVGMCLDDKQSWEHEPFGGQGGGQVVFARELDLAWTSARVACEWYSVEGGNPVFLPEGCSPQLYSAGGSVEKDIDVCFVGAKYGFRAWFIEQLQDAGLNVHAVGSGWPSGSVSEATMVQTMQRSKVVLGLGGIGWSPDLKNVKGRDFDAPCLGAYVTSFNPDLTGCFEIGQEIACYSTPDEAVEVVRDLLHRPDRRADMAARGRARCIAEHTWEHRFTKLLELLGIWQA